MKTSNQFADFLLTENRNRLYSMLDCDAAWEFVRFFHEPLVVFNYDNQGMLAKVTATTFLFVFSGEGSIWKKMPAEVLPLCDRFTIEGKYSMLTTAGGIVSSDWCSDQTLYEGEWCQPCTVKALGEFEIHIETGEYDYSVMLRTVKNGFIKAEYGWIQR